MPNNETPPVSPVVLTRAEREQRQSAELQAHNAATTSKAASVWLETLARSHRAVRELLDEHAASAGAIAELRLANASLQEEITTLTNTNLDLVTQADALKNENADVHKALGTAQESLSKMESFANDAAALNKKLSDDLATRGLELSAAKDNLAATDLGIADRDQQIATLKEQVTASLKPKKG